MTSVLTAVGNHHESQVATLLERSRELLIARRCADLADLLAAASAGLGSAALVSADLRGLDLSTVVTLRELGLHVVGLLPPTPGAAAPAAAAAEREAAERHLRQLGVASVVGVDDGLEAFERALAGSQRPSSEARPGAPRVGDGGAARPPSAAAEEGDRNAGAGSNDLDDEIAALTTQGEPSSMRPDEPSYDEQAGPLDSLGRIVAVWGPTGAPGRTTVAVNLAAELAGLAVPTLLVDADTYGGCVGQVLSLLDEAPGLAAATRAAEQGTLDRAALSRVAPQVTRGLRVLTGLPKAERWPEIRPAALERVLTVGRSLAQVVVVDCGFSLEDDEELSYDTLAPRRNAATLTTLAVADELLAVGGCDPVGLQRLVRGLQELGTVQSPPPRVVVNRVRASAVGRGPQDRVRESLRRFAGVDHVEFVPDDRAALDAALLEGRTLAECAPQSPARAAIRDLALHVARMPASRSRRDSSSGRRLFRR